MVSVVTLALVGPLDVNASRLVRAVVVLRVDALVVVLDGEPGNSHSFVAQRQLRVPAIKNLLVRKIQQNGSRSQHHT